MSQSARADVVALSSKRAEFGRDGDRAEAEARLNALFDEHRTAVLARTLRLTGGDLGWAEDVVQETFLRAWRRWDRMTADHGRVLAWLVRVAHNLVMDGYRSARHQHEEMAPEEVTEVAIPEATDQILSACLVRDALRRLPDGHRLALEATYLDDQTAEQAAHALNLPVGTVKSRVFYGLRMLRSIMDVDAAPADVAA
jgi:RNA polymerase sigma-70 factor (ECF subfamily)